MKKSLFIICAIALLSCSGCSFVSLGYNNADWLLRYKINDYTSFDARQKEEIRQGVAGYMQWHRKNALPEYIAFLQDLHEVAQRDGLLKTEEITRLRGELNRLYRKTMAPSIQPAARLLSTMDSAQIEELGKTFAKNNRKQRKEELFGSEQKNLAKRAERGNEVVEKLAGNLSEEQAEKITAMSLRIPFATQHFIENREAHQARLIDLLNNHAGEDKIAALLWARINTPEADRTPQQQQVIQAYENAMTEMTVRIYALLTERQKDHLRKKISSYIEDFKKLHEENRAAVASPAIAK